jgi:hypothetical protein
MHTSDVNRLEKLKTALLLAAFDMDQAAAAARALRSEAHDVPLMHALESAIAVCYSRAFSQSTLVRLTDGHKPIAPADVELHEFLVDRRNKAYAHTDRKERPSGFRAGRWRRRRARAEVPVARVSARAHSARR